jgi:hypothetical protein
MLPLCQSASADRITRAANGSGQHAVRFEVAIQSRRMELRRAVDRKGEILLQPRRDRAAA